MSFQLDIIRELITTAEKLEENGVKATTRLDDKAQQTGGLAGIFLAAGFGFLKPESLSSIVGRPRTVDLVLLLLIIVSLVVCLACCLSVTWLRFTPVPPTLPVLVGIAEDLLEAPAYRLNGDVQQNYYRDRLRLWQGVLVERAALNKIKARRLLRAQFLLATGMLCTSALLISVICSMLARR